MIRIGKAHVRFMHHKALRKTIAVIVGVAYATVFSVIGNGVAGAAEEEAFWAIAVPFVLLLVASVLLLFGVYFLTTVQLITRRELVAVIAASLASEGAVCAYLVTARLCSIAESIAIIIALALFTLPIALVFRVGPTIKRFFQGSESWWPGRN